ncbi:MAG: NAD-dependent epimerase/dehydratase family protein [Rikenellaceae bacterium]|nr:NAD-dependent epimerase/dehydratase family protein [Rikenellaceae bacterium]
MNKAINIGITGESGFIGRRLVLGVGVEADFVRVPFERAFFGDPVALHRFVQACDVVVHLAAQNRPSDDPSTYQTNIDLTERLIRALQDVEGHPPAVIFASSIREGEATAFGQSKAACRRELEAWAAGCGGQLLTLRLPNTFGEDARPFDNSFIATFSCQLLRGIAPVVTEARRVPLIHVDSLCRRLIPLIRECATDGSSRIRCEALTSDFYMEVSEVLRLLEGFHQEYRATGAVTTPADPHLEELRRTFLSYCPDCSSTFFYPKRK